MKFPTLLFMLVIFSLALPLVSGIDVLEQGQTLEFGFTCLSDEMKVDTGCGSYNVTFIVSDGRMYRCYASETGDIESPGNWNVSCVIPAVDGRARITLAITNSNATTSGTTYNVRVGDLYATQSNITTLNDSITNVNDNVVNVEGKIDLLPDEANITMLNNSITNVNNNVIILDDKVDLLPNVANITMLNDSITNVNNNVVKNYDFITHVWNYLTNTTMWTDVARNVWSFGIRMTTDSAGTNNTGLYASQENATMIIENITTLENKLDEINATTYSINDSMATQENMTMIIGNLTELENKLHEINITTQNIFTNITGNFSSIAIINVTQISNCIWGLENPTVCGIWRTIHSWAV